MTVSSGPTTALLCSDADERVGDGLAGSSATFTKFVLIDHRGSWSSNAARDAVEAAMPQDAPEILSLSDLRPFAVRPIGRSEPVESIVTHIGRVGPAGFMNKVQASSLAELKTPTQQVISSSQPLFAICTNGSRDRCCALKGRPLALRLHQQLALDGKSPVVEISHLGGHRFASTMMVLPWGYSYGRLTDALAAQIATAAQEGLVHPAGLRGRADLSPAAQAADIWWRNNIGAAPIDSVIITDEIADEQGTVVHATVQGRSEHLTMTHQTRARVSSTLCGGKPFTAGLWLPQK